MLTNGSSAKVIDPDILDSVPLEIESVNPTFGSDQDNSAEYMKGNSCLGRKTKRLLCVASCIFLPLALVAGGIGIAKTIDSADGGVQGADKSEKGFQVPVYTFTPSSPTDAPTFSPSRMPTTKLFDHEDRSWTKAELSAGQERVVDGIFDALKPETCTAMTYIPPLRVKISHEVMECEHDEFTIPEFSCILNFPPYRNPMTKLLKQQVETNLNIETGCPARGARNGIYRDEDTCSLDDLGIQGGMTSLGLNGCGSYSFYLPVGFKLPSPDAPRSIFGGLPITDANDVESVAFDEHDMFVFDERVGNIFVANRGLWGENTTGYYGFREVARPDAPRLSAPEVVDLNPAVDRFELVGGQLYVAPGGLTSKNNTYNQRQVLLPDGSELASGQGTDGDLNSELLDYSFESNYTEMSRLHRSFRNLHYQISLDTDIEGYAEEFAVIYNGDKFDWDTQHRTQTIWFYQTKANWFDCSDFSSCIPVYNVFVTARGAAVMNDIISLDSGEAAQSRRLVKEGDRVASVNGVLVTSLDDVSHSALFDGTPITSLKAGMRANTVPEVHWEPNHAHAIVATNGVSPDSNNPDEWFESEVLFKLDPTDVESIIVTAVDTFNHVLLVDGGHEINYGDVVREVKLDGAPIRRSASGTIMLEDLKRALLDVWQGDSAHVMTIKFDRSGVLTGPTRLSEYGLSQLRISSLNKNQSAHRTPKIMLKGTWNAEAWLEWHADPRFGKSFITVKSGRLSNRGKAELLVENGALIRFTKGKASAISNGLFNKATLLDLLEQTHRWPRRYSGENGGSTLEIILEEPGFHSSATCPFEYKLSVLITLYQLRRTSRIAFKVTDAQWTHSISGDTAHFSRDETLQTLVEHHYDSREYDPPSACGDLNGHEQRYCDQFPGLDDLVNDISTLLYRFHERVPDLLSQC